MTRVIENSAALLVAVLLALVTFGEVASVPMAQSASAIAAPVIA